MKINTNNVWSYLKHLAVIKQLSNLEPHPNTDFAAADIYQKLCRIEKRAHRLATDECNTGETPTTKKGLENIEKKIKELLPNVKTFFLNGDPRGYTLKLQDKEAKELGIYTDFGGYGILAPEF